MAFDLNLATLSKGQHNSPDDGMCMMEAVTLLVGEPFSDHPQCVDPVIGAFCRTWQDKLPDAMRQELALPLVHLVIGTRSTPELQDRRAIAVADWCIRHVLPAWLRLTPALAEHAKVLGALSEMTTPEALESARRGPVAAARAAAWDAADDAAGAAARAAAWDAADDAAGAAADDAAWVAADDAAWDAADEAVRVAAWVAADDAARAAALDAAHDADDAARAAAWVAADDLDPIVQKLQRDGANLIRRLCAMSESDTS